MPRFAVVSLIGLAIVVAACATAVFAHVLIDALGDIVLRRDAYDGVAHSSRVVVAGGVTALAALALLRLWCAAFANAHRSRHELRDVLLLAATRARNPLAAVGTVCLALALVATMECLDVRAAGESEFGLAALFGGALWLGLGVTSLVGFGLSRMLACLLLGFARAYDVFVEVVHAVFLRRATRRADARTAPGARRERVVRLRRALLAQRAAKRGPPRAFQFA